MPRKPERHNLRNTKEYNVWASMLQRCSNPKCRDYCNYGGRGIRVCSIWQNSFIRFIQDMGECPEFYTLERVDNDGPYSPENCEWSSRYSQSKNKRKYKNNTTGFTGVRRVRVSGWEACIGVKGSRIHLGTYNSLEEAAYARKKAEEKYWD